MVLQVGEVGYLPFLLHRESEDGDALPEPGVVTGCEEDSSGSVVTVEAWGSYVKITGQSPGTAKVEATDGIRHAYTQVWVHQPGSPGDIVGATL